MPKYLFDTNILSFLIKQPRSPLAAKISDLGYDEFCTSMIVASELRYGALKKGSPKLSGKVEDLLQSIEVLPMMPDVSSRYAAIRSDLEKRGQLIGANDMFIAAHALEEGLIVVTDNIAEFSRVKGLVVENWLER